MTTRGTDRLRRSLDNQRGYGLQTYELDIKDMETLVREVERERDALKAERDHWSRACAKLTAENMELACECAGAMTADVVECPTASDGKPLRIGDTVWGQDGKQFTVEGVGPEFVWGRAEGKKTHKRLRPEWLTHERPDSWERVERDARTIDECCTDLMSAADLVARCKRLAGVK